MLRRLVAGVLICLCSLELQAQYTLSAQKIAANTWVVEGSTDNFSPQNGGNIVNVGFIETPVGVVVIDTGPSFLYGQALRQTIAEVSDKPIIKVLLTHHHPDHVLGNQAFSDIPIAALTSTTALLAQEGEALAENMYRLVGDGMRGTEVLLPNVEVAAGPLKLGDYQLQLYALSGHTGADLVVFDPQTGVLFAGDLVFYQRALTTPHTPGLAIWQADLTQLEQLPWRVIVPGHGPIANNQAPFAQMHAYLNWLDQLLRHAAATGEDMNQVLRSDIPAQFKSISLTRYELTRTVSHLYPTYEKQAFQLLNSAD